AACARVARVAPACRRERSRPTGSTAAAGSSCGGCGRCRRPGRRACRLVPLGSIARIACEVLLPVRLTLGNALRSSLGMAEWMWPSHHPVVIWNVPSVVYVKGSVGGDPNNEGNAERGTQANPFNTLEEATYCVLSGGEIRIAAGSYNEQFTIRRALTLKTDGSGTVTIGN